MEIDDVDVIGGCNFLLDDFLWMEMFSFIFSISISLSNYCGCRKSVWRVKARSLYGWGLIVNVKFVAIQHYIIVKQDYLSTQ